MNQNFRREAQSGLSKTLLAELRHGAGAILFSAACGLPAFAQGAPSGSARQPAPSPGSSVQAFVIHSERNLVLVDVRVRDRSGGPVTDLRESDFKVFEDGVPQTITSFSPENVEQLATATPEIGPPPVIDLTKLAPNVPPAQALRDRRLLALFFDLTSMPVDDLVRALKAAREFVRSRMTPADLVAVATYTSSLRIVQNFTNDRDALTRAIQSIRVGEASSLAEAGPEGDAGSTNASGVEVVAQDVSAAFTPDETEFNIFNTDEKLSALESLARLLKDVPGRKAVVHFSSGVARTGVENQTQLRATTDAANRANVSLYTIDARGLVGTPAGGDASSAPAAGTALYSGQAVRSQFSSLEGGRETLTALAADTGGRAFYNLNDFGQAFSEIQKENSTYYLLGYSPTNSKPDGRFRRIRVAVTRPGVKVEARPGYFAPKNFRRFTREDKELQLEQAMNLESPFVDLPIAVEAAYFRQPDGRFYVVLAAKMPGSAVSFLQKSAIHQTQFDFAWRAADAAGQPVAVLRDTLPLKLNPESYQQVLNGSILYEGGFVLPPGSYHLKAVARENESGKIGTFEQPLVLPAVSTSGLALSSVVVSNQLQDSPPGAHRSRQGRGGKNPLQFGSRSILPSVTRVFRTNQNLYLYLESYESRPEAPTGPDQGPTSQPIGVTPSFPPSVALVFFRGGIKISEAGPFPGKLEGNTSGRGKATYFIQIPLAKFPPGRYSMQVNVLDPALNRAAFARLPIAIMRTSSVPSAQAGQ